MNIKNFPFTPELKILAKVFLKKGDEIRLVGGCVRNFLMKKPLTDFDIACVYEPKQVMNMLIKAKITAIPTGIKFGTITAIINKIPFEITSLRKDIETDGRHAEVTYTNKYSEDAERRDFTINALYLDFEGNIYDYFNGLDDIKKGIIKFIQNPEQRIKEDYLRILRFFRFYCYYGFTLDKDSLKACAKLRKNLNKLSAERIKVEMFKILKVVYSLKTLKIMQDNDILQQVVNTEFDLEILETFASIKDLIKYDLDTCFILSLLLEQKKDSLKILEYLKINWKLSNKEYYSILFLLTEKLQIDNIDQIKEKLFYVNNKDKVIQLLLINFLYSKKINKIEVQKINDLIKFIEEYKIPEFPVNGNDLLKLGKEGRELGEALSKLKKVWVESDYKLNKQELLSSL